MMQCLFNWLFSIKEPESIAVEIKPRCCPCTCIPLPPCHPKKSVPKKDLIAAAKMVVIKKAPGRPKGAQNKAKTAQRKD